MTCGGCENAVKRAVGAAGGVAECHAPRTKRHQVSRRPSTRRSSRRPTHRSERIQQAWLPASASPRRGARRPATPAARPMAWHRSAAPRRRRRALRLATPRGRQPRPVEAASRVGRRSRRRTPRRHRDAACAPTASSCRAAASPPAASRRFPASIASSFDRGNMPARSASAVLSSVTTCDALAAESVASPVTRAVRTVVPGRPPIAGCCSSARTPPSRAGSDSARPPWTTTTGRRNRGSVPVGVRGPPTTARLARLPFAASSVCRAARATNGSALSRPTCRAGAVHAPRSPRPDGPSHVFPEGAAEDAGRSPGRRADVPPARERLVAIDSRRPGATTAGPACTRQCGGARSVPRRRRPPLRPCSTAVFRIVPAAGVKRRARSLSVHQPTRGDRHQPRAGDAKAIASTVRAGSVDRTRRQNSRQSAAVSSAPAT